MHRISLDGKILHDAESHLLCGGTVCDTGNRHCKRPCLIRKSFDHGYAPGNLQFVCCFVANYLNRKGMCSSSHITPDDMCPCGSGKPMKVCIRNESK